MRFSDLIVPDAVELNLRNRTKDTAIKSLVKRVALAHGLTEKDVLDRVMERERALSTGVGQGVAVPHTTLIGLNKPVVALGRTKQGIAFDSIDGEPVRLIFLLLSPDGDVPLHLKLLSRISRLCQQPSLRKDLLDATSHDTITAAIQRAEHSFQDL